MAADSGANPAEPEALPVSNIEPVVEACEPSTSTATAPTEPPLDDDAEITRLAALSEIAYERTRLAAAKHMGLRPERLDKLVKAARGGSADGIRQGRLLALSSPEPWPEPVDGAALLDDMTAAVRRHVVMEDGAAEAVALWVIHAHALNAFNISPRLAITSPEKGCGKTTCLDVVSRLVPRPLSTSNTTTAAIFRTIEMAGPTLLIDEADTFLTDNDEMRGVLNSGHRRSGKVVRLVGDKHEPRSFSTWAPVAIAMIGRLPDTLEDRSVPIRLRRRLPCEPVTPLRVDRAGDLDVLGSKAARWAADHWAGLTEVDPDIPPTINNRAADNWRVLLSIADAAGGEWPTRARAISEAMVADIGGDEAQSAKVMLLEDIRAVFEDRRVDRLSSADLVRALIEMEGRPWCEWRRGQPLTQNTFARLLAPFRVSPGNVRIGGQVQKGYRLEQFSDAFVRYATPHPAQTATPLQMAESKGLETNIKPLREAAMLRYEKPQIPQNTAACSGVAVQQSENWEVDL